MALSSSIFMLKVPVGPSCNKMNAMKQLILVKYFSLRWHYLFGVTAATGRALFVGKWFRHFSKNVQQSTFPLNNSFGFLLETQGMPEDSNLYEHVQIKNESWVPYG